MNDCETILERLSHYLDQGLPQTELDALRRQARQQPGCAEAFEAMLWVHQSLNSAPMQAPAHDMSMRIVHTLGQRQQRQRWLLAAILLLGALTAIMPLLALAWALMATTFFPDLLQSSIALLVMLVNSLTFFGAALFTIFRQLPQWALVVPGAAVALSMLALALALALQQAPEQMIGALAASNRTA